MLQIGAKQLSEAGRPVKIGGRAFDLLRLLVERAGQVVTKDELMACAWPKTVVEEINLRVHIAALRKALGDGQQGARYIASVAGRGYAFLSDVFAVELPNAPLPAACVRQAPAASERRHNLPATLTRLLGREDSMAKVEAMLSRHRFVSIVGAGGIGKTAVALAVASKLAAHFRDGVWLVELANLSESDSVLAALGDCVDFSLPPVNALAKLVEFLRPKSMLVVFDNAEHLVQTVAKLASKLLNAVPDLHLLLTSREPTRADGEWVVRLPTLELPTADESPAVHDALAYPAVSLFVERAIASQDGFELTSANVGQVVDLCRKLDGLPFAIELAAARVDTFGVSGTLKLIEEHSRLLAGNSRALLPRHRAMGALLDWGYNLLTPSEQILFRKLSVFRGQFCIRWGISLVRNAEGEMNVMDGISSLTSKSLLQCHAEDDEVKYRMLQTTRDYAYGRLEAGVETNEVRRRHAEILRDFYSERDRSTDNFNSADWQALHGNAMDEVRFAMDWAFGPSGDVRLAIELALASVALGMQLGQIEEVRQRVEKALEFVPLAPSLENEVVVRLRMAYSALSTQVEAPSDESERDFEALSMSDEQGEGDPGQQVDVANALWLSSLASGDYPAAMKWANRIADLADETSDPDHVLLGYRTLAASNYYLGLFEQAVSCADFVLSAQTTTPRIGTYMLVPLDRRVSLGIIKSRTLWITGRFGDAMELVQETLQVARADVSQALGQAACMAAVPIALWAGDDKLAQQIVNEAIEQTSRHHLTYWRDWLKHYDTLLQWRAGKASGDPLPKFAIESAQQRDFLCTFEPGLLDAATIARVDGGVVGWCAAEAYHASAVGALWRQGKFASDDALLLLDKAINTARQQGALYWELRAATTLSRFWLSKGNRDFAAAALAPVYGRITQGFDTRDFQAARAVMRSLEGASLELTDAGR